MTSAAVIGTRRKARPLASKAAHRRASPHRDASWFELIVGLAAFVALSAGTLYLLAWLGR